MAIGVSILERDEAQFISTTSPLRPGVVIRAPWGPSGKAQTITSIQELESIFGAPKAKEYLGIIGIKKFFRYGNTIRVARVVSSTDVKASVTLNDGSTNSTLVLEALYEGEFGNGLSATLVTEGTTKTIKVFLGGVEVESYAGLSKSAETDTNTDYKNAINGVSDYITVKTDSTADANANEPDDVSTGASLAGGADNLPSSTEFVGTSGTSGVELFSSDTEEIDILLAPDAAALSTDAEVVTVNNGLTSVASGRGDVLALLDAPKGKSATEAGSFFAALTSSTYSAAFWPWVEVVETQITAEGDRSVFIPASLGALSVFANNDAVSRPWYGAFGINRGVLREAEDVEVVTNSAQRTTLADNQVNVFTRRTGVGTVLLGNLTKSEVTNATQSINIRRLLIFLKKRLLIAAESLIGEPVDQETRNQFVSMANRLLTTVQNDRGLNPEDGFLVVCDASNNPPAVVDEKKIVATIKLRPTRAAEIVEITLQVTDSGAVFDV